MSGISGSCLFECPIISDAQGVYKSTKYVYFIKPDLTNKDKAMDAYDLIKWREMHFELNRQGAAKALGIAFNSLKAYEKGTTNIPPYIPLACAAIAAGLGPWSLPEKMLAEKKKNPKLEPSSLPRGNPQWMGNAE